GYATIQGAPTRTTSIPFMTEYQFCSVKGHQEII
ncbi:hypothetical protein chiPu_0024668, partial [Chiloscyllium punctatum]|nr:hypothetical protein [Chiloscyllium punctatum]